MTLCLLLAVGTTSTARADGPAGLPDELIELQRCRVEFARTSTLGSPLPGVLKECKVRPGDRVGAGQLIGRLRDEDVRAEWELRRVTGENPVNIQLAETRKALADTKLIRAQGIKRRGYVSDAELQTAECEAQLAVLDVNYAKQQLQLAQIQAKQAEALLHFREFVSPHRGVVFEIFKTPGESISPNFPVFRIVDDEKMHIIGQLDVVDAWRVGVGQPVAIWPTIEGANLPVEREKFEGVVILVEGLIDQATHTCKIVAEVPNRSNLLRAGLEARMEIHPRSGLIEKGKAREKEAPDAGGARPEPPKPLDQPQPQTPAPKQADGPRPTD